MQREDRQPGTYGAPGELTYTDYLKVDELLSLQNPLSQPVAHDELLFIVIHQSYELWFKLVLFELDSFVAKVFEGDLVDAIRRMDRVHEIFRVLVEKISILETMTPVEFNRFRSKLNPASGFQSWQFREIELLASGNFADCQRLAKLNPEWKSRIESRMGRRTLRDAFMEILRQHAALDLQADPSDIERAALELYRSGSKGSLPLALCEAFIRFDESLLLWRFRHVQMVERMIGMKMGTGATLGVRYLQATLEKRFFPELWALRSSLI